MDWLRARAVPSTGRISKTKVVWKWTRAGGMVNTSVCPPATLPSRNCGPLVRTKTFISTTLSFTILTVVGASVVGDAGGCFA